MRGRRRIISGFLIAVAGLALGFLLGGNGAWQSARAFTYCLWLVPLWGGGMLLVCRRDGVRLRHADWPWFAMLVAILLFFVSKTAGSGDYYYLKWIPGRPWLPGQSWLERTLLLGGIFFLFRQRSHRWVAVLLFMALVYLQFSAFFALLKATGGEPMYRVDHPSFFYRFWSWGQTVPRYIYYDPNWNGGKAMPYLIASGILAPGFLLWPVWRFMDIAHVYTPTIGFLFLFLIPVVAAFSARAVTRNRAAWIIAAILSLGTSQFTFIHLVHYGTFGSIFSASFLLPISACLYRLIMLRKQDGWTWASLFISSLIVVSWPPGILMLLPLIVTLLLNAKRLNRRLLTRGALLAIAIAVIFAMPALSVLVHSNIGRFGLVGTPPTQAIALSGGFRQMGELLRLTNPVLLFAGILGLLAVPQRRWRTFFLPIMLSCLVFAAFGKNWKPLLQLDRIWINALFISILPSALVISRLLRMPRFSMQALSALLCGMLVMGGYTTVKYMGNKGRAQFNTMSDDMKSIVVWIRNNVPPDGRLMFAGSAVHGYGGGKVAALPVYTGREMMACDYYGFSPKLVEYNYPPQEFRKHGPEKMFQFMELYNVTHIVTYHELWKQVLRRLPDQYEEVWAVGPKVFFRVKRESSRFQEGAGRIEQSMNRIDVYPEDPNEPVVIKYNWVDGLQCDPESAIAEPYDTGTSVMLIRVQANGAKKVRLSYKRWY